MVWFNTRFMRGPNRKLDPVNGFGPARRLTGSPACKGAISDAFNGWPGDCQGSYAYNGYGTASRPMPQSYLQVRPPQPRPQAPTRAAARPCLSAFLESAWHLTVDHRASGRGGVSLICGGNYVRFTSDWSAGAPPRRVCAPVPPARGVPALPGLGVPAPRVRVGFGGRPSDRLRSRGAGYSVLELRRPISVRCRWWIWSWE